MKKRSVGLSACILFSLLLVPLAAEAQPGGAGASPVRFTEVLRHPLQRSVELTGSVESRRASIIASEVSGLVEILVAREGDIVRKGDPLVRLRRQSFALRRDAVRGQLQEAEARLELAKASLDRYRGLFDEQVISRQQLDDALSEAEAWEGRVAQLEADADRLSDDLARSTVRAPFDGVVAREHVGEGEWLAAGDDVAELVDTGNLEITLEVPESYFAEVEVGEKARIRFASLGGLQVEGEVRAVVPRANAGSRTFPVKITLENSDTSIAVGMLVRVVLPVGAAEPSIMVPKDAVVSQGPQSVVFRILDDQTVERVVVATGRSQGGWLAVVAGLEEGDRVITRGNERIFPGQQVEAEVLEYELP